MFHVERRRGLSPARVCGGFGGSTVGHRRPPSAQSIVERGNAGTILMHNMRDTKRRNRHGLFRARVSMENPGQGSTMPRRIEIARARRPRSGHWEVSYLPTSGEGLTDPREGNRSDIHSLSHIRVVGKPR